MKSTVRDIVRRKGAAVLTVTSGDTVFHAISLMAEANVGAVLVRDGDAITGMLSERDYMKKVVLKDRRSRQTQVREIMSSPVITIGPDESVDEALEVMTTCRCRHLPVVESDDLLGIISIGDLVRQALADRELEIEQLSTYIAGSY